MLCFVPSPAFSIKISLVKRTWWGDVICSFYRCRYQQYNLKHTHARTHARTHAHFVVNCAILTFKSAVTLIHPKSSKNGTLIFFILFWTHTKNPRLSCRKSDVFSMQKVHSSFENLIQSFNKFEEVPLVEFMYLVFTRISGESYLWWSLCTLYLHACQMKVTSGGVYVPCIYTHIRWKLP